MFVTAGSGGEPFGLADETGHMFRFAGGKVAALADDGRNHREGVRLEYFLGGDGSEAGSRAHLLASAACEELSAQDVATSVIAVRSSDARVFDWPPSVPTDALLVRVGPKHDDFFLKRWIEKDAGRLVDPPPTPEEAREACR